MTFRKTLASICFCLTFGLNISAVAEEIIVGFRQAVTVEKSEQLTGGFRFSLPEVQRIADQVSPQSVRNLFPAEKSQLPELLKNVQIWQFPDDNRTAIAIESLQKIGAVAYVQPNYRRKVHNLPNDPLLGRQWYLKNIRAAEGWQHGTGDPSVIVGVIDTGIDYQHEDLQGQLWINTAEDLNGNGRLDSLDLNGVDDDGNGYTDDVWGWDFTDAPGFPDGGDFRDPDNDPMDEYGSGHGTPIAGLIAAKSDNGIGISGVASGVRVMNLRAGTASGFLEEDDVAEAIVYAVDNGCKIVNMSFGDVAFSYLLRDAIEYGISKGAIFVASSGNSGNAEPNYPAAFSETISVGATDSTDQLSGFSSFGNSLNIAAPGSNVFATQIGSEYGPVNGTSFSAPLVCAALALIWSQDVSMPREQVIGALYGGAQDLGFFGWDRFFGHGLIDIEKSLTIGSGGFAEITAPPNDGGVSASSISVTGTAISPDLDSWSLAFGIGETPFELIAIATGGSTQLLNETLGIWQTGSLMDTVYTLELRLKQRGQSDIVSRSRVFLDRSAPQIVAIETLPVIIGADGGVLIRFDTDDPTAATLRYRPAGSGEFSYSKSSRYFQNNHVFIIEPNDFSGAAEGFIELENAAGLAATDDNGGSYFRFSLNLSALNQNLLTVAETLPVSGFLMPAAADFRNDGRPEIVFSELENGTQFGGLTVGEWQSGGWQFSKLTEFPLIPRDAAAVRTGDGVHITAGFGNNSLLLGGNTPGELPDEIVWDDTTNFWVSKFGNYDNDAAKELFALNFGQWKVFDISENSELQEQQTLAAATSGNNQFGVPITVLDDFDGDGRMEIALEDLDGDVLVYEANSVGAYQFKWANRMNGSGGSALLASGDLDGDGLPELVSAVRNQPNVLRESNVNAQFWAISVWRNSGSDQFSPVAAQQILGVTVQSGIFNGLTVADLDGDNRAEIVFTPFPRAYVLSLRDDSLAVQWFREGVNSNSAVVADVDGNGKTDVLLNSPDGLLRLETAANGNRPPAPTGLTAMPLDTTSVQLSWRQSSGAAYYRIFRKLAEATVFQLLDSTETTSFFDGNLINRQPFDYAISQINPQFAEPESPLSQSATAQPNVPPVLQSLLVQSPRQLQLQFSEAMAQNAFETASYRLANGEQPASIIRSQNRREALVSFRDDLPVGTHTLVIGQISDDAGTPLTRDSLAVSFTILSATELFSLKSVAIISKTELQITFSAAVDAQSASDISLYSLKPAVDILSAYVDPVDRNTVIVNLSPENRIGSLGEIYQLRISGMLSENGTPLDNRSSAINLTSSVENLDNLRVYPNPYRISASDQPLRFANLPEDCEIWIFSANGQLLRKLQQPAFAGAVEWDLQTAQQVPVASGVYVYVVRWNGQEKKGKLLIIQ